VLRQILPASAASAHTFADAQHTFLYPEERLEVASAVERRRREFATARSCARAALARLGIASGPIPRGRHGAPRWPAGVVGSITHCEGFRASAVARAMTAGSLGLDAEPNGPLPALVLERIAGDEERAWLGETSGERSVHWDRLLFSAKECVYKAWYPLTGERLVFSDATVSLHPDGCFAARLAVAPGSPWRSEARNLSGRWLSARGLLLTAIVTPPVPPRLPTGGRT